MNFSVEQVAELLHAPVENVRESYPLLDDACAVVLRDEYTPLVEIAMLATVRVETGIPQEKIFLPIPEFGGEAYLKAKPYYPYYGRGFIQLTWDYNYRHFGKLIGVNLLDRPEQALDPSTAALIFALFFKERNIPRFADARDWLTVRKRVNGGFNGYEDFFHYVQSLRAAYAPPPTMAADPKLVG